MRNLFLSILLCNQKKVLKNSLSLSLSIYIYIHTHIYISRIYMSMRINYFYRHQRGWIKNMILSEKKKNHISFKITKLIKLSLKSQYGKFVEGNGNQLHYSRLENLLERRLAWYSPRGSQRLRHNWSDLAQHMVNFGGGVAIFW